MTMPRDLRDDADALALAGAFWEIAEDYETRGRRALAGCSFSRGTALRHAAWSLRRLADRLAIQSWSAGIDGEDLAAFSNADLAVQNVAHWFDYERPRVDAVRHHIATQQLIARSSAVAFDGVDAPDD